MPALFVGNSEAVQERVAERTLDLGFIEGDSHLGSLQSEMCCEDELQVVCAPSHPLAQEAFALPSALTQHPYIGREPGSGTRAVIDRYLQKAGVSPESLNVRGRARQPRGDQGPGRHRPRLRHHVARHRREGAAARPAGADSAATEAAPQLSPWCIRRSASTPSWSPASSPSRRSSSPPRSAWRPRRCRGLACGSRAPARG